MTTESINTEKRDMFITYTETLSWVLYVIQSIKEKGDTNVLKNHD